MLNILASISQPLPLLIFLFVCSFFCAQILAAEDPLLTQSSRGEDQSVSLPNFNNESPTLISTSESTLKDEVDTIDENLPPYLINHNSIKTNTKYSPNHYTYPPISISSLRRRFGATTSIWGDWTPHETRLFYKQQLPRALQIDGALGLSLEERAKIASANRHALRIYARERCVLPARYNFCFHQYTTYCHFFNACLLFWASILLPTSESF